MNPLIRRIAGLLLLAALLLALDVLLFVPGLQLTPGAPTLRHVSLEFAVLVVAAFLAGGTFLAWPTRLLGAIGYVSLLVFLTYHQAYFYFFHRAPALIEDWHLLRNLKHFLQVMGAAKWTAITAGVIIGVIALGVVVGLVLAGLQRFMAERRPRWPWALAALVGLGIVAAPRLRNGIDSDEPLVQVQSKRIRDNWVTSAAVAEREAELAHAGHDRRYEVFSTVKLQRKPDFYLLMIEAYGEILATWDMAPAYDVLMRRVEKRLSEHGYHMASAYSAAPVHGGTSWFSISTLSSGILVDRPLAYSVLNGTGTKVPSLRRFFHEQGYRTYALTAGIRDNTGLQLDIFGHDELVVAANLQYPGPKWGWGEIPDQYTLGWFGEHVWADAASPRYLFYMSVSTHYPWGDGVAPYYADWKHPGGPTADVDASWPALPEKASIGSDYRRSYFQSVEYEWRVLTEFLDADKNKDVVILVVGDHQPRLENTAPEITMNSPVHLISRDPALVQRFREAGFQPGMLADPHGTHFKHEGLFSLVVSNLAALYGNQAVPYFPDGIGLSGLNP
jgi:phosphoglycerol transferase MdoB-like AlkP superfamily enzyme